MRRNRFYRMSLAFHICRNLVLPAVLCMLLASCATTKVTAAWRDNTYGGTFRNIVIVGVFENPDTRLIFEEDLRDRLKARGVKAVGSHEIFPGDKPPGKEAFLEKVRTLGADGVIVTRMLDSVSMKEYSPGKAYAFPQYYGYFGGYYDYVYRPGYTTDQGFADTETNLYEVKEEKLVWSIRSDTQFKGNRRYELIQAFDQVMIGKLSADRLIP